MQYYKADVKHVADRLDHQCVKLVCDELTSLMMQDYLQSRKTIGFCVNASGFEHLITTWPSYPRRIVEGDTMTMLKVDGRDVMIRLGLPVNTIQVEGVVVEDVRNIRGRNGVIANHHTHPRWGDATSIVTIIDSVDTERARAAERKAAEEVRQAAAKIVPWKEEELTEEEKTFAVKCKGFDWYYGYSDDRRVYQNGEAAYQALIHEKDRIGGKADLIFKFFSPATW